ncbi:unnamed protein product [Calypogeia fissa]
MGSRWMLKRLPEVRSRISSLTLESQTVSVFCHGELGTRKQSKSITRTSHFSSSTTSLHCAEGDGSQVAAKRVPVQVGASLTIDVSRTAAAVNVTVGDNLEEVVILPKWLGSKDYGQFWKLLHIRSSDNKVDVQQAPAPSQSQGVQLPEALVEMNASMPARWCSLVVRAGKGSVYIQNVREGNLSVSTGGGTVKLGEMKGSEACIDSGGGDVEANVVQAQSSFVTGGGKLWVKRLQGLSIALDSGGGNVVLGSLYGDDVTLESKGGSVEAKEIQTQNSALICSRGGDVVIHGIDGKAAIESQGGNVEIQLNEHAEEVTVDAGKDGHVVLCLSSRLSAQLKYEGNEGVVQEGCTLTSGSDFGTFEFTGREVAPNRQGTNSGWRGSENYLPGGVTACKIHVSSARQVRVKQRSWFELVTSKAS